MRAWDLGGHEAVRELWRDYYLQADAILFMVDTADLERVPEARDELHALMDDPDLRAVPVAVLANKRDLPVRHHPTHTSHGGGGEGGRIGLSGRAHRRRCQWTRW
jgi:GTPase SAR1 family protein